MPYENVPLPGFEPIIAGQSGYVYVGARGGYLKIGYSAKDPYGRMRRLGCVPLIVRPGSLADEQALHARFRSARIDREWFLPAPALLAYITAA